MHLAPNIRALASVARILQHRLQAAGNRISFDDIQECHWKKIFGVEEAGSEADGKGTKRVTPSCTLSTESGQIVSISLEVCARQQEMLFVFLVYPRRHDSLICV